MHKKLQRQQQKYDTIAKISSSKQTAEYEKILQTRSETRFAGTIFLCLIINFAMK